MLMNPLGEIRRLFNNGQAMGSFNVDSPDMLYGVLEGAVRAESSCIVQVTEETLDIWGWKEFSRFLVRTIEDCPREIGLHLDHALRRDSVEKVAHLGFTSIMYDGSLLPLEDNRRVTRQACEVGHRHGMMVEGEIGHVAKPGDGPLSECLTNPHDAAEFAQFTGVDCLAVAVGTRHGEKVRSSAINLSRLQNIHQEAPIPLVLHGSSGVGDEVLAQVIGRGVAKVNIGSELRNIWWEAIVRQFGSKPRTALASARNDIADYVEKKIKVLKGHALDVKVPRPG